MCNKQTIFKLKKLPTLSQLITSVSSSLSRKIQFCLHLTCFFIYPFWCAAAVVAQLLLPRITGRASYNESSSDHVFSTLSINVQLCEDTEAIVHIFSLHAQQKKK